MTTTYPPRITLELVCTDRGCLAFGLPRQVGLYHTGSGAYRHEARTEPACPVCSAPLGTFPAAAR